MRKAMAFLTKLFGDHIPRPAFTFLLIVGLLIIQHGHLQAQDQLSSAERWTMRYDNGSGTALTGEVVQSGGKTRLKWTHSETFPDAFSTLDAAAPFDLTVESTSESGKEIQFRQSELAVYGENNQAFFFLDGKPISEAEYAAYANTVSGDQGAAHSSLLLFLNSLLGNMPGVKDESGAYRGVLRFSTMGGMINGGGLAGMKLRLFNPQSSKDGKTTKWDWEAQIGMDAKYGKIRKGSGSSDAGNPIIWGPTSEITHIIVANDQSVLDEKGERPLYPILTKEVREGVDPKKLAAMKKRELVIIGRDLDNLIGESATGGDPIISYSDMRPFEKEFVSGQIKTYSDKAVSEDALKRVETVLAEDDDLKAYWVTATLNLPIKPLLVPLSMGDASGQWALNFGDNSVLLAIIKPKTSEFIEEFDPGGDLRRAERLGMDLHFRDEVVFDAHVKTEIEDEQLEISFIKDKVMLGADIEAEASAKIILKRDPEDPRHFRSQSYILGDASAFKDKDSEDTYSDVPADRLLLVSGDNWLRPRLPEERQIRVISPYPDQQVKHADETISGDFIAALKMSTICAGSSVSADWDRLSVKQESEIARGLWDRRSVSIPYGQHAAMLLVSGAFIDQAEAYLDELNSLRFDTNGLAFKRAAANVWTQTPSVMTSLAYAPRTGIYASINSLKYTNGSMLNERGKMRGDYRKIFVKLLVDQTENLRSVVAVMKSKPSCDVEGLLTMVGKGFGPIISQLKNSVTRLQTNSKTGVKVRRPDMVAIRELERLSTTFNELKAKSAYSDAQLDTINAIASVGGLATGIGAAYYGSTALAGLALAADGVDFATNCSEHICGYIEDQENLTFGKAATGIIGSDFLNSAEGKAQAAWLRAVQLGVSGAAAGSSAFGFYKDILKGAPKGGLDELMESLVSPATPADLKDVYDTASGLQEFLKGKESEK